MTKKCTVPLSLVCLPLMALQLWGAETPAPVSGPPTSEDLQQLRERIAKQEEEIKRLQESVEQQRVLLDKTVQNSSVAPNGASTVNVANASRAPVQIVPAVNVAHPRWGGAAQHQDAAPHSPLSIGIGDTTFTPLGFVDATFYGRSSNVGSGIGTNFGGIPYNNTATGHLSEANFSTQNSRIGFRVDSNVLGGKVLGYFEADFLGQNGGNVFVTSNSNTFRMRNVFVDWQKNGFEILGGQDWSFATPN